MKKKKTTKKRDAISDVLDFVFPNDDELPNPEAATGIKMEYPTRKRGVRNMDEPVLVFAEHAHIVINMREN